jgi:SAM-dependent methyltransferase
METQVEVETVESETPTGSQVAPNNITHCYDSVAEEYGERFLHELDYKPFDQLYLKGFFEKNQFQGKIIDFGCGPGQTTKFLYDCGCRDLIGTDISKEMVQIALKHFPFIPFEVADMLALQYPNDSMGSAIAFYSIVNFSISELEVAFKEIFRVLRPHGQFLFSFHTGENSKLNLQEFLSKKVNIDFYFFNVEDIHALLRKCHFRVIDTVIRYPYAQEHPSKRAYITVEKCVLENTHP